MHRVQLGCVKKREDFPTNMTSPLPETQLFHVDPGNGAEDHSDRGYETTATVSLSSSTSNEIESMASIHLESGQPGGHSEAHVPSRNILPFNPTQFDTQQVVDQLQSRVSDNRDREDARNKVNEFVAEDNNHERDNDIPLNSIGNNDH